MIHDMPLFAPGGDRYIEVELGDEMSFELNVRVHALTAAIREARIEGVIELIPEMASLQLSYDADRISYEDLVREVVALHERSAHQGALELDSRLFTVPALYFDPWTAECVDDYRSRTPEKVPDPELVLGLNGLRSRAELRRTHSATEYWVASLGFWPGLASLMPLDPRARLVAPKYNPPRSWTPKGAIGIGGSITCIYPDRTPGGYQLLGRTPMPVWDREQRLPAFRDSLALFRPGDRVRFLPIEREEFDQIETLVAEGRYEHPMIDYQSFSLSKYRRWVASLEAA